jgi:hypothetical protein
LAANGSATPLTGNQYEFLTFAALCEFAILADTGATVLGTVYSGSDVLMQSSQVNLLAVASPIIYPDHFVLTDVAGKGERLNVQLQENAAGTPIVRTQVRITPM